MPIDDALENLESLKDNEMPEQSKDESSDFDLLLSQMLTEKGKNDALVKAVEIGITNKDEHLEKAYQLYVNFGNHPKAGEMLEKLKRYDQAFVLYANYKLHVQGGELAERLNNLELALDQFAKAAESNKYYHIKCGEINEKLNRIDFAIIHYKNSNIPEGYNKAARLLEQKEEFEEARMYYRSAQNQAEVERLENSEKYLKWFMKYNEELGFYTRAANVAKQLNESSKVKLYSSLAKMFNE